jgi:hypothetical protein
MAPECSRPTVPTRMHTWLPVLWLNIGSENVRQVAIRLVSRDA